MLLINPVSKDSFIYERYPYMNNGGDPVLEIGTDENGYEKRIVLEIDTSNIEDRISYYSGSLNNIYLNLYNASIEAPINPFLNYYLSILSASFEEGVDLYNDYLLYRQYDSSSIAGVTWALKGNGVSWNFDGGDYTQPTASITVYNNEPNIRYEFLSTYNSLKNNYTSDSIILIPSKSINENIGQYRYYSKETNTFKNPFLDLYISIPEESYTSGSLQFITLNDVPYFYPYNNPYEIKEGTVCKFKLKCRKQFPSVHQYMTSSILNIGNLVTGDVIYRIINKTNNTEYIPFNDNSIVYYNTSGYYFYIDFTNFPSNTYYSIDIKVKEDVYEEKIFSNLINFKVIE